MVPKAIEWQCLELECNKTLATIERESRLRIPTAVNESWCATAIPKIYQ
jgi:hypothetical protein